MFVSRAFCFFVALLRSDGRRVPVPAFRRVGSTDENEHKAAAGVPGQQAPIETIFVKRQRK